jgi:hypothetical protein
MKMEASLLPRNVGMHLQDNKTKLKDHNLNIWHPEEIRYFRQILIKWILVKCAVKIQNGGIS